MQTYKYIYICKYLVLVGGKREAFLFQPSSSKPGISISSLPTQLLKVLYMLGFIFGFILFWNGLTLGVTEDEGISWKNWFFENEFSFDQSVMLKECERAALKKEGDKKVSVDQWQPSTY